MFALDGAADKLDYLKLDQAFEGEQQVLYAQEAFYTADWERRVFRKIGEELRKKRKTVEECFDILDDSGTGTISISELKQALIRFDLRLTERQLQKFIDRIASSGNSLKKAEYITKEAFKKRFWAAYTYDELTDEANQGGIKGKGSSSMSILPEGSQLQDRGRIASGLQQKLKNLKILRAIQQRIHLTMTSSDAFKTLDNAEVGFLTLSDFQIGLSKYFGITLRQDEVVQLFLEIDRDSNGLVQFQEWDMFYRMDFGQRVQELENEKERMVTQYDIFDHLLKVLKKKGLTLEEMFDQIDLDKN